MLDTIINIEDASFSYVTEEDGSSRPVINGVTLGIERGRFTVVIGRNGSGKSTLAKLMNGILVPDKGKVFVDGIDTADESRALEVKKTVGMVFQNPDNQLVATICEEDVAFGPENLGVPSDEIRKRVDASLAAVGMTEYAKSEPHRLSGGQKQRIAIAGVLAMEPECVIFDESTAMLDPRGREEVLSAIRGMREKGITVVMITHYMEEACLADRVVVIDGGRIAASGTPLEIFSNEEALRSAGLKAPQNVELVHRLREKGLRLPVTLSERETAESIAAAIGKDKSGN